MSPDTPASPSADRAGRPGTGGAPGRRPRSPARWIRRGVILLIAGLAGTYVGTWGGVALLDRGAWSRDVPPDRSLWDAMAQPGWPAPDEPGMRWITPTLAAGLVSDELVMGCGPSAPVAGAPVTNHVVVRTRHGLWLRILERRVSYSVTSVPPALGAGPAWTSVVAGVKDTGLSLQGLPLLGVPIPREYALTPIWPAFAIAWAIHAALVALAWWAVRAGRPAIRRWRGLCAACGYSLEGLVAAVCPECGSPVAR